MTDTPKTSPDDSSMFAPIPSWERNRKRRGFGGVSRATRPVETPTFADPPAAKRARMTEPQVDALNDVDPASSTFAAPPVYATRTRAKSSSAPVAIAAGLILIGGIAAAGWYYTQPHGQTGVAELTPGGGATTTTTTDTSSAPAAPSQMAQNTPPPAVAKATTTTTRSNGTVTTHTRAAAPARSRTVSDTAADASTTAPAQAAPPMPMPTPGVAPPASAAPAAPLVLNIPPAANAPASQPVNPPTTTPSAPPPTQVPQA